MFAAVLLLAAAIAVEVGATAILPRAQGFTDPTWSVLVVAGYGVSAWLLALVVRTIPVSTAYAVWSGLGTAVIAGIGLMFYGDQFDWLKVGSLVLIVVGVVGLNLAGTH